DAADVAAGERGGGHRDREERLAGTGRTDPEGDGVVSDRVDVALLVDGLRRDPRVAVLPDDVLEDLRRALVLVEGARDRLDRARCDLVSLFDQVDELPHHGLRRAEVGRIAVECEDVPAQEDVDVKVALESAEDGVLGPGQLRRDRVVDRELQSRTYEPDVSFTA